MKRLALVLLVVALAACQPSGHTSVAGRTTTTAGATAPDLLLPNPKATPGAAANLTQAQVCAGQRDTRPPQTFTANLKRRQLSDPTLGYGTETDKDPQHYEEDHLIPLELGGAGSDVRNLWPEPGPNVGTTDQTFRNNPKDGLEGWMHHQVCIRHTLTLADAQHQIATDWVAAWKAAGEPMPISKPPYYTGGHR